MPKVSVVVLSRDHAEWVARAIQWLSKSTVAEDLEVIVVDDCSVEPLMPVLEQLNMDESKLFERSRMVRFQEPAGDAVAYNFGLDVATAPYVGFCDGKDLWLDGWKWAIEHLDRGADVIGTGACERYGDESVIPGELRMRFHHSNLQFPLFHIPYIGQSFLVRRETSVLFRPAFSMACQLWSEPSSMVEVAWWVEMCAESVVAWSGHNRIYRELPRITWYATPEFRYAAAFVVTRPDLFTHPVVSRSVAYFESCGIDVELVKTIVDMEIPSPGYDVLFDSKDS